MEIRRFREEDAKEVSTLICRNFKEVNIKDYPLSEIERLVSIFTPEYIKERAGKGHMYVACDEKKIVGTATISDYYGSKSESIILGVFVLPELQGKKGIGRMLIETVENDELGVRAERIEIPASITARKFYIKCGYQYKKGKHLDNNGYYRMEKRKENISHD